MAMPTLDEIFEEADPYGLLEVQKRASGKRSGVAEKDRAVLEEADAFVENRGHDPELDSPDIAEAVLARKLASIRDRREIQDDLREIDTHGLLKTPAPADPQSPPARSWRDDLVDEDDVTSLDDILDDEDLVLDASVATPTHVTPAAERRVADHRGERTPCRDFEQFRPLFEDLHAAVSRGNRELIPFFKGRGTETLEGDFYVQKGLYAYVAEKAEGTVKGGRRDHRLRVIYSNGTESDVLMRSFEKALYDDPTARRVSRAGFGPLDPQWEQDRTAVTGYVYVARSLSSQLEIARDRKILHKIGVTSGSVERRIADARNDATFLFAPVEIIATYELVGVRRDKVEHILHTFFADARADIEVPDRFGGTIRPREWFYVLPRLVAEAVDALRAGNIQNMFYDVRNQRILPLPITQRSSGV